MLKWKELRGFFYFKKQGSIFFNISPFYLFLRLYAPFDKGVYIAKSIFISLIISLFPTILEAQNILKNPSFEEVIDSKPSYWDFDVWKKDTKGYRFGFDERSPHSGTKAIVIEATEPNDLKIIQKITVKPESIYKFSCWVKASNIPKGNKGANLSALDILDTSESLYETRGQWQEIVFYGKTLKGQTEVFFTLRLGGYGSLNKGIASFDDCKVELLESLPNGIFVAPLKRASEDKKPSLQDSSLGLLITSLFSILFISLMFICLKYLYQKDLDIIEKNEKNFLFAIIIITTIIKLILSYLTTGFPVDLITYKAWSDLLVKKGLAEFYYSGHFVDYPPLFMYVFYIVGFIRNTIGISYDSQLFVLLLKTPSIITEALSLILIYKVGKDHEVKISSLYLMLILFGINPVLIINTCLWGQVDSFLSILICIALILLYKNKVVLSSIIFTLSILTKPQALMYTPIFLLYFFYRKDYREITKAIAFSIFTALIVIIPFSLNHGFFWIVKIFKNALVQYPFATLNAFNIHALFGNNWA
ncbi:MAG: glycosyltransferase 87 family protein, partial [Thermodesulfovibrionales bacterium]|nr:glycosyltransferase 87 family protein [Thermodesulfovibrionales bacterium]